MTETLTTGQLRDWFGDTEKIVSDVSESMRNLKRIGGVSDVKQRSSPESRERKGGTLGSNQNSPRESQELLHGRKLRKRDPASENNFDTASEDNFEKFMGEKVRFSLVVQLCKLYVNKDTERRNFHKLFNRLKYDKYNNSLKQLLKENRGKDGRVTSKAELTGLVNDLLPELEERVDLIYRMRTLRDRLYAHSDPGKVLPEVTVEELDDLVQLSVKIFNTVSRSIFGRLSAAGEG